jgi:hypothetical protein
MVSFLCFGIAGFVNSYPNTIKSSPYVRENLESFTLNEKILADRLRDMPLTGALVLQADMCLLWVSYGLLLERASVYTWVNKEWLFFLPFSLLYGLQRLFLY